MKRRQTRFICIYLYFLIALATALAWGAPTPKAVKVNRTPPDIKAAPMARLLRPASLIAKITRARVFSEPLIPLGGAGAPLENQRLSQALMSFLLRTDPDDTSAHTEFSESAAYS